MQAGDGKRALVVEDDSSIRELLQLHLGLAGFDVHDVGNGREALDIARTTPFDLLVLDVMLPGSMAYRFAAASVPPASTRRRRC